jgi:hypothetical protein
MNTRQEVLDLITNQGYEAAFENIKAELETQKDVIQTNNAAIQVAEDALAIARSKMYDFMQIGTTNNHFAPETDVNFVQICYVKSLGVNYKVAQTQIRQAFADIVYGASPIELDSIDGSGDRGVEPNGERGDAGGEEEVD